MTAKQKQRETLPKIALPGSAHTQMVRCGRPNCKCAKGELHGPYVYRFWREKGRLRKMYVKQSQVGEIMELHEVNRLQRAALSRQKRKAEKQGREDFRRLLALVRELEK